MAKNYSDAFVADGPLVFVSGQVPEGPDGSVPDGDAVAQMRRVFDNLAEVLAGHGAGLRDVVKINYYLRHIADLQAVRQVPREYLREPLPAATLVEVTGLADSRYLVEIDAVACLPRDRGADA